MDYEQFLNDLTRLVAELRSTLETLTNKVNEHHAALYGVFPERGIIDRTLDTEKRIKEHEEEIAELKKENNLIITSLAKQEQLQKLIIGALLVVIVLIIQSDTNIFSLNKLLDIIF